MEPALVTLTLSEAESRLESDPALRSRSRSRKPGEAPPGSGGVPGPDVLQRHGESLAPSQSLWPRVGGQQMTEEGGRRGLPDVPERV